MGWHVPPLLLFFSENRLILSESKEHGIACSTFIAFFFSENQLIFIAIPTKATERKTATGFRSRVLSYFGS